MSRSAGPKATEVRAAGLDAVCICLALASTPRFISSVSRPGSTNNGRRVVKFSMLRVSGAGWPSAAGGVHWTGDLGFLHRHRFPNLWLNTFISMSHSRRMTEAPRTRFQPAPAPAVPVSPRVPGEFAIDRGRTGQPMTSPMDAIDPDAMWRPSIRSSDMPDAGLPRLVRKHCLLPGHGPANRLQAGGQDG